MFNRQTVEKDSLLSNEQLANMLVAQTIEQLQQFTQLSAEECEKLVEKQFTPKHVNKMSTNVISNQETDFITSLFN